MSHTYTVHFCTLERELPMADRIAKTVLDNRTVNLSLRSLGTMKLNKQKSEPVVHVMYVWTGGTCYVCLLLGFQIMDVCYQLNIPLQSSVLNRVLHKCRLNSYDDRYRLTKSTTNSSSAKEWILMFNMVDIVCDVCVNSHSTFPLPHLFFVILVFGFRDYFSLKVVFVIIFPLKCCWMQILSFWDCHLEYVYFNHNILPWD